MRTFFKIYIEKKYKPKKTNVDYKILNFLLLLLFYQDRTYYYIILKNKMLN